jgi:hypothetical protein
MAELRTIPAAANGTVFVDDEDYYFQCPHCREWVCVAPADIKCKIFRHGVFKKTLQPIPPHSTKQTCDQFVARGKIFGCGKPFTFDGTTVAACGYI